MKRTFLVFLAAGLLLGLTTGASAHIGGIVHNIFEITPDILPDIDFNDDTIEDWEDFIGEPNFTAGEDFFSDPTVGDGAQYDPADLDFRIWLGWESGGTNRFWFAIDAVDDVYVNEYEGGNLGQLWKQDAIELMLDGDHTGGQYGGISADFGTQEEIDLENNRTAQQFVAIASAPDDRLTGYLGKGAEWVNAPPLSDFGGAVVGDGPTQWNIEFYVTPYDNLIWNDPEGSTVSQLSNGKIIGVQISVPDFDTAPSEYHAFHTLSGQPATFKYADRFVDGRLVGVGGTAVEANSWGRVKASFGQ
jgi:hypothetical protein